MTTPIVPNSAGRCLDWLSLTDAISAGHRLPRAEIGDTFLYRGPDTLLNRAAWIDGLGILVKSATVFPGNPQVGAPVVNGGACLYADHDGRLEALVDFHLLTKWKTAGDSLLAARHLARKDTARVLIVGAGTVAASLREAYAALFPDADFTVWARRHDAARDFADTFSGTGVARDLATAVHEADVVTCATMATEPLIRGEWLRPGQHLDLIGAYRHDMREADDEALARGRIFVDSRATTIGHIGELMAPIAAGAISREDVIADFYDLEGGLFARRSDDEITVFKNGGGAHLDLMCARYILGAWEAAGRPLQA